MRLGTQSGIAARFRFFTWLLAGVWTVCVAGSLLWNLRQRSDQSLQIARRTAQVTFENDVLYRRWSAQQGGVYVRVSEATPPNPYLQVPDRDVTTMSGLSLTLVNPAYMARQVNALADATAGSRGHLTSLKPMRPENAPDAWEAAALRSFEQGVSEVSSIETMADGEYLRLMRPFVTEESCLKCHAAQGYQKGDIRGGISVSVPMAPLRVIEKSLATHLALGHAGLWLVGLTGIGIFRRTVGQEMLAREQARAELQREVAERQRAEAQLREANDRYELVLAGAGAGLWDWDVPNHKVLYSPRWKAMRGFAEHEVSDAETEWSGGIHPEDTPRVMAAVQALSAGQTPVFAEEYRVRRKDGSWIWIADRGIARQDATGRVVRMAGSETDITERKRAEEAVRRSEARWNAAIESFAAGAIIATEDEQVVYWNPAAREMHGFTRPDEGLEPLEKTPLTFQLWTPDGGHLLELDEWPMRRIQRGETVRNLELRIRRPDQGWEKVFSYSGAMVETAGGERLIFLSVFDLTMLRQAEAALRESRRAALNLMDDAVAARQQAEQTLVSLRQVQEDLDRAQEVGQIGSWRLDVRLDVLQWSDENHRIFGVPKGTPLTYETFLGIVHPDDRQYVDTQWQASLRGEPYDIDHRLVVDGQVKWVREKAYLEFDDAGRLLGGFGITEDITDRKRAEEELRRAKEDWERTFDAVPDLIAILDREHRVIRANRAMAERLNLTPEQCVGMRCYEVVHGTSQPPESCPHSLSYRDGREHSIELEGTRLAGQFMVTTSPQFDGQGRVVGTVHVARDIAHLKQTEKALQRLNAELEQRVAERTAELAKANAYNRSLIEAAVDPLVTIGPDGKITDVNAATEAATGRTRKELIGTDFSDYFTQPEKAREGYQRVFREGFVRDYPLDIRHHAGGTTPVLYNASVYRDETGKVIGVFAAARDITERLRAERALQEERQRLYDLLETLPVYVALLSTDYHVSFANRFFRERFGESHGRRCFEFLFQRPDPCENCETYKVLSTHAPGRWEWTGPDGRNYDIYDFPFLDTDGSTMILEMGIDITERKKAQRAVEASEARYRSFVTASTQLSWTTDAQGLVAEDMPTWRAFTGQSLEQIQGWGWADAVHPDDRRRTAAIWSQAVASRSLYAVEYRLRRHDGQYRWLSVRGVPVLVGDTVREWVGACTDITERKLVEEETRRMREELGHVDRVARLGELTSSLAHELNQPLAAILSNAQAARRVLASDSPDLDLFREILDDIIQDDKRAGSVIHRLRLMLQKGKQEPERFQINDAIREVVQLLHSEAVGRNAALAVDLPAGLPAVWAGRVEFQQVMVNLLLNALDAVRGVPLDRREILVQTRPGPDAVVVAVRDRGCGLPSPDFNSIFEPFFTTKSSGLGMGLAICRRMIQAYGGRIWAANNEDAGATVSFSLPSAAADGEPSHD